jgi:hypothetical protein
LSKVYKQNGILIGRPIVGYRSVYGSFTTRLWFVFSRFSVGFRFVADFGKSSVDFGTSVGFSSSGMKVGEMPLYIR